MRGRSLAGTAWQIHTGSLLRATSVEELVWWQMIMQPIPQEALERLGIEIWQDERLEAGANLTEATARLWPLVIHMADLAQLPEAEGVGEGLILDHVEEMMGRVNSAAQPAVDAASALLTRIIDVLEGQPPDQLGSLTTVANALQEFLSLVLPSEEFEGSATLEVREFRQWSERLHQALDFALTAQLAWATTVVGDSTTAR